jgi:hypothetical protein
MSHPSKKHKPLDPLLEAFIRALARDQAERDIRKIYGSRGESASEDQSAHPHSGIVKRGIPKG